MLPYELDIPCSQVSSASHKSVPSASPKTYRRAICYSKFLHLHHSGNSVAGERLRQAAFAILNNYDAAKILILPLISVLTAPFFLVGWDLRHQVLRPLLAYCTAPDDR
jgi:hypothetical protein